MDNIINSILAEQNTKKILEKLVSISKRISLEYNAIVEILSHIKNTEKINLQATHQNFSKDMDKNKQLIVEALDRIEVEITKLKNTNKKLITVI